MRKLLLTLTAAFLSLSFVWGAEVKISASDAGALDWFGYSVSISGDYAIVGGHYEDEIGSDAGAAYIFIRSGTTWIQQAKIFASDAEADDFFGISVSISGDYAIVGAHGKSGYTGAAYIFIRSGTSWTQQAKISASDAEASDFFGYSVSISEDYAVVGAYGEDDGGNISGAAYVFNRSGTSWTQQAKISASDAQNYDYFGRSVSISGDYAIMGAYTEDAGGNNAGAAYIFNRSETNWTQQAKISASDAEADDNFGRSVSISGDYAVVGAPFEDDGGGGSNAGAVYVYHRSDTSWTQQVKITASDAEAKDNFGYSVSISGSYAIVGARYEDEGASDAGAAYIFIRSGTSWTQQAKINASDADVADHFGTSVSINGDYSIVGAYKEDTAASDAGAAYIYSEIVSGLIQKTNSKKKYRLFTNYPNPFNPKTIISYQLPVPGFVELAVYNLLGQKVRTLVNTNKPAGTYSITWDGSDETGQKAASGIYIYKIKAENFVQCRKMILMR